MAFPWAAAISGVSGIGGNILNYFANDKLNHDARNFALMQGDIENNRNIANWQMQQQRDDEVWNRQNSREDEVWNRQNAYNLEMWNMQNAYNSPAAQMARYKEAGLNPNLIYGQSNSGGSISTGNLGSARQPGGSPPKGGRPGSYVPRGTNFDLSNGVLSYYDAQARSAQVDNLRATNDVIRQEAQLKSAQTIATLLGNNYLDSTLDSRVSLKNRQNSFDAYTYDDRANLLSVKNQKAVQDYQLSSDLIQNVKEVANQNLMKLRNQNSLIQSNVNLNEVKREDVLKHIDYLDSLINSNMSGQSLKDAQKAITDTRNNLLKNPEQDPRFWLDIGKTIIGKIPSLKFKN